jgi:hypothetical protein
MWVRNRKQDDNQQCTIFWYIFTNRE